MKRIAVVTGSRSEYDMLYSSMLAIKKQKELHLQVIVTGAHLLDKFGNTYKEIEKDGFIIDKKVRSLLSNDTLVARAKSAGIQITGLSAALDSIRPDVVLVAGDREEVICAALAANYLNIPVAHMGGGDTAFASVDNTVRDATTKLSHIHFAMLPSHAERIIKMGEEEYRVHVVGHGGLDRILTTPLLSKKELSLRLQFNMEEGPVVLMIQHVLSSEYQQAEFQVDTTLSALAELQYKVIIGYPNSDVGSEVIIKTINRYGSRLHSYVYKNLSRILFINLLRHVDVLIGNSSCGIIEAPLLKLPVVNIGNRQHNRTFCGNVLFVEHDKKAIKDAIKKAIFDETFIGKVRQCESIYSGGYTGEKVAEILKKIEINNKLLNKPNL